VFELGGLAGGAGPEGFAAGLFAVLEGEEGEGELGGGAGTVGEGEHVFVE
jgi:hypothetical protein